MQRFNRASLALLVIAAVFWSLFLVFVGLHLAAPSDGARIVGGTGTGGLQVAPFASYGLQENDTVIAVGGRSAESLALALGDLSQPAPQWAFGQKVIYTVLRDGEQFDVPITLGPYPLGAIWAKDWGAIVVAIIIQLTMGFVFFKRPDEPIAQAMFLASAALVSATTWSIGLTMADVMGKVGFWLFAVSSTGVYMLIWVGALHSILLFPRPWPPLARHRWIVPALYLVPYLTFAVVTLAPPSPDVLGWQQNMGQTIGYLQAVYGLVAIVAAFRSYRAARDPVGRAQVRWVTTGFVFAFFCAFIFGILPELILGYPLLSWSILALVGLVFPVTLAVAILRYRLFDIDVILNRALVYGILTTIVVALYVVVVGGLSALLETRVSFVISLLVTALAAVIFQPLRERLQRAVNRLMYGERDEPYLVLTHLGQRLEATLAPNSILPAIVETVAGALKLPYAAITLRDADADRVAATFGLPTANTVVLPLTHQHELIGHLHIAQRSANEPFTPAEQRLLGDIARQIGVAAHNVRLTADLQRSRERLVTTREEERRRLRRDLHDGLGPTLASQTLKLDAALDLLQSDPAAAAKLLTDLKAQSQSTVADIRRVIYELRPPALDELGVVAALRAHVGQYNSVDGLRIQIESPPEGLPLLSAAVEVAAYHIAVEALANVVRHARARECCIRFSLVDPTRDGRPYLHLEITDDGIGLPDERRAGVGLSSMRERAEELGGACVIERRAGGGTRVTAKLPINGQAP
jgi:signal transduction histidine kinase